MISDSFSSLMRSLMVLTGMIGFALGFGLSVWRDNGLPTALFRGALLCVACTLLTRFLLLTLFRAYMVQMKVRKEHKEKPTAPNT